MNLSDALKYGVLADFRSGDKQDQFDGLLQTVAKDPVFGMGVLADFAEDHNYPLAPVFRRLANGEGRVGDYQQQAEELIDHAEAGPHVPLHLKTKKNSDPAAYLSLYHHHSEGPVWRLASHLGWKDGEWPQGHSVILPARPEEIEAFRKGLEEDGVAHRAREVGDFQARSENMQHYKTLEDALKYDTEAAKSLEYDPSGNSDTTSKLHSAIKAFVKDKNHTALAGIADLLQENDHPLHAVVGRLFSGEGREVPAWSAASLPFYAQQEKGDEFGSRLAVHLGLQRKADWRDSTLSPSVTVHPLKFRDGQAVFHLNFSAGGDGKNPTDRREFIIPATKEEIDQYAQQVAEIHPKQSKAILTGDTFGNTEISQDRRMENHARRQVGIPELPESEQAEHHHSLEKALKYVTAKPEDMLHLLPHSGNASSLIWADLLDDHNHSDLAARVRREAEGSAVKRPQPEEGSSSQDDVQHLLHLKHPSPAIRALADGGESPVNTDYLVRALRLSPNHFDQDAGVWLAQGDIPHPHHAAKTHFDNLSNRQYAEAGLVPKLVGDTLYLLDWEHTPEELRDGYHAPAIRYHAPISDRKDLDGMIQHAEQLRSERQGL